MKFSQRIGKVEIRNSLQIESIDEKLSNRLWNIILNDFLDNLSEYRQHHENSQKGRILLFTWKEFFGKRADKIHSFDSGVVYERGVVDFISEWFFTSQWYEKYDFIEFLLELDPDITFGLAYIFDSALKKEMAGYRIINNKIVQVTSEQEVEEIEKAINQSKWAPVQIHLTAALDYLSNRNSKDYRNSVKESISAVESLCSIIVDEKGATLGKALNLIETRYKIHKALKSAFSTLYGYSSDSGGIRHSLLEDDITVSLEDAKFMLISCSAFINYLKTRIE
ncbi:MAG: AbiJ-NTD4 domain-containing protein [Flavobacteriaceae bacterium]